MSTTTPDAPEYRPVETEIPADLPEGIPEPSQDPDFADDDNEEVADDGN